MKIFPLFILLFGALSVYSQTNENKTFHFRAGAELRVTPIYLQRIPNVVVTPDRNILPQEGDHLGGLSFIYSIEKEISESWSTSFTQQIRYDFLYAPLALNIQQWPDPYFRTEHKYAMMTDLRLDVLRSLSSRWKAGLGIGVGGLGSRYLLTERFRDVSGGYFLMMTEQDYIHPFVSASIAWQWKGLQAHLRANYTKHFPGYFHGKEFIQPVLGVQYQLFSF